MHTLMTSIGLSLYVQEQPHGVISPLRILVPQLHVAPWNVCSPPKSLLPAPVSSPSGTMISTSPHPREGTVPAYQSPARTRSMPTAIKQGLE
jgi:hypothetical protein